MKARKWLLRVTSALLLFYGACLLALFFGQDRLLFIRQHGKFSECGGLHRFGYEAVNVHFQGQHVRYYLNSKPSASPWIFFFHGNADSACDSFFYPANLEEEDLNFVLVEYPGYQEDTDDGESPSQSLFLANADAAFESWKSHHVGQPVFVMGESLGTGVATYIASKKDVRGLILRSPYTSIADVAASQYPLFPTRALLHNPFPADSWAPQVQAPVLAIHGSADRVIPISIGRKEGALFHGPLNWVTIEGAGHGDLAAVDPQKFWGAIAEFVQSRGTQ